MDILGFIKDRAQEFLNPNKNVKQQKASLSLPPQFSLSSMIREFNAPRPQLRVQLPPQFSVQSIKKGFGDFLSTVGSQPVSPQLNSLNRLSGGKTWNPTLGDAGKFAWSIPQGIARVGAEGTMTLTGNRGSYKPQDFKNPDIARTLYGDEPLRNWLDPQRAGQQFARDIGAPQLGTPLVLTGAVLNVMPLTSGKGKVVKEGTQAIAREGVEQVAKQGAMKKLRGLLTYTDDLVKRFGFSPKEADQVGYKQYRQLIDNAGADMRSTKEILDEAQWIKNPHSPLGDSIGQMANNVKNKVNILDYFRTPDRVLQKIGFGDEAKLLRTKYDDYLQELPVQIDKITEWSKRVPSQSNQRIFQWLDGRKVNLADNELQVAQEIKGYLKEWAERLKLPEDKRISNYITHIFEKGVVEKDFDPAIAQLIRNKVAGSVYDPFLQKRIGKPEYIEDTWRALDAYVKRATRKVHMDEALIGIQKKAEQLDEESYQYLKGRIDRINLRPTWIENLFDNAIKSTPIGYSQGSRPFTAITQKARQAVFRGLIGLNPATAFRNLQQSTNTYAVLGEKYFLIGTAKTVRDLPRYIKNADTELDRAGVLGKDFIQDRTLSATKQFWQQADEGLFYMFNLAEKINRSIAYHGAKAQALKKGVSDKEAVEYAKKIVRQTQFNYDVIDTPAFLQNDLTKTLFQFGTYPLKQTEFMVEMMKDKNIAGSVRFIAANLLFIGTAGKILGLEPDDMFPTFRFGAPPTLQAPLGAIQAFTEGQDKYGNELSLQERILNDNLTKGLMNYVPAGGQIRKTFEGAKAVLDGGSYTDTGKLRYPTEGGISPLLFGTKVSPEAKAYYNKEARYLGERETELYKSLLLTGMTPKEAYDAVASQKTETEIEEPQNLLEKVTDFMTGVFGGKKEEKEQAMSDDPLIKIFNEEAAQDEKAKQIKKIFEMNLSREKTEQLLEKSGLGDFEEASLIVMKSLGVENGNRGRAILEMTKDMDEESKYQALFYFAENEILTSGVINEWLDSGEISQEEATALKNMIKQTKGTFKGAGGSKAKKAKSISIKSVSIPAKPRTGKLSFPKLSAFDQAMKLRIPSQPTRITRTQKPAIPKVNTEIQYRGRLNSL